jgi:hypothetical protein
MPMKSISNYIKTLRCKHTYHISALPISDKLVRFSSECVFCGKRKYHYVNGEISIVVSDDYIAIPCIYLLSKRQDFKEKYKEMKETVSK